MGQKPANQSRRSAKGFPWAYLALCIAAIPSAAVEIALPAAPANVFGGRTHETVVSFRNTQAASYDLKLAFRLFQASTSTLAPVTELRSWKELKIPGNLTASETVQVPLPEVRGATTFYVAWFDGERKLGTTKVRVFPAKLLERLSAINGQGSIALFDPEQKMQAAFGDLPLDSLSDLTGVRECSAKLIIVAEMSNAARPNRLASALKEKAAGGQSIVWFDQRAHPDLPIEPRAFVVPGTTEGGIVVADPATIADLKDSPAAQLTLIRFAELALHKTRLELPSDPD